jgi:hypothetical protein
MNKNPFNILRMSTNTKRNVELRILTHNVRINPLKPELNPSAQRCLTRFLLGILLLEPCISLNMREKPTNATIIHSVY